MAKPGNSSDPGAARRHGARVLLLVAALAMRATTATAEPEQDAEEPAGQSDAEISARRLFRQGRELFGEGRYGEACALFQQSLDLYPSVGARLNLGGCLEEQGKYASALSAYVQAAQMAAAASDLEREATARQAAAAVQPKVALVVLVAPSPPPDGMELRCNGDLVEAGTLKLDPGRHRIEAHVPGHEPWSVVVDVPSSQTRLVEIPTLTSTAVALEGDLAPLQVAGYTFIGTGAAAVVVSFVVGGLALADRDEAEDDPALCPDRLCSEQGVALIEEAEHKAIAASVTFGVGAALVATGIVLAVIGSDGGDGSVAFGPTSLRIRF